MKFLRRIPFREKASGANVGGYTCLPGVGRPDVDALGNFGSWFVRLQPPVPYIIKLSHVVATLFEHFYQGRIGYRTDINLRSRSTGAVELLQTIEISRGI